MTSWRTSAWLGPYAQSVPPTLGGSPVVGSLVGVQPGSSSGGWEGQTRERLVLCASSDGKTCVDFAGGVLTEAHLGRYLFAIRTQGGHAASDLPSFDVAVADDPMTFTVTGTKAITVPIRRGKLAVRVHVDGKLLANGTVVAR